MSIAFKVYVRCPNCQKDFGCKLEPPEAEESPQDIDELLDSNFLQNQRFECQECGSVIGTITGIKLLRDDSLEEARTLESCF